METMNNKITEKLKEYERMKKRIQEELSFEPLNKFKRKMLDKVNEKINNLKSMSN